MTRAGLFIGVLAAAVIFACAPDAGPFFTPQRFPEDRVAFNRGRIGLLTPSLSKENELVAFRVLSGLKVADETGKESERPDQPADVLGAPAVNQEAWRKARSSVADPPFHQVIGTYRTSHSSSQFVFYANCLDNAFETAAGTLQDRRKQYASQQAFAGWVVAQDQVFTDCSSTTPAFPEPAASSEPALVRADRDYQIAAAHFYAEDLQEAERRFRAIAADQGSPWQRMGNYMVARTLLREMSLQKNAAAAGLAKQEFARVAGNPSTGSLAESARGLIEHLDAVEHPGVVMESLSKRLLLARPSAKDLAGTLHDSAYILTADSFSQALSQASLPESFDWVQTLEKHDGAHAVEKWANGRALPWLTLSLMYANGKDKSAATLIEEAGRLTPDSPAFGTATYNAIRLQIEQGEREGPRQKLDALLATSEKQPDSLVDGWRAERMRLARDFDDFLQWAPRKPVPAEEFPGNFADASFPVLAPDGAEVLNYRVPLSKLIVATHSARLPPWSAADVALATWTRAFMLNDAMSASDVAPVVAKAHPDWASSLRPEAGAQADGWRFRAALLVAQHHEFQPLVPVDYRTHLEPGSWWCQVSDPANDDLSRQGSTVSWRLPAWVEIPDAVISQQERNTAKAEVEKLHAMGSAQSFLGPIILDWAKAHPEDPLVPQALHRLVFVVRYGCHYNETSGGQISKSAFDLLHKRYPTSEWTAKTPYWFK